MELSKLSLIESFNQYFSVELATAREQVEKTQRVRYRVYCEELGYESAEKFPDGLECDEYDGQSLHVLITHKGSGLPAGCVRLIQTQVHKPLLPLEQRFPESLDPRFFSKLNADRSSMCEISRLAVDPLFRRRHGESGNRLGDLHAMDISYLEFRSFSVIAEAAFVAAAALTGLSGMTNAFALMEPYLGRLLNRSGIYFLRIGRNVQLHGLRAPYFIDTETLGKTLNPELLDLYDKLFDELQNPYQALINAPIADYGGVAV